MNRSTQYALELCREKKEPLVLFDQAEVACFLLEPTLFPVLREAKGWRRAGTVKCTRFSTEAVWPGIADLVTGGEETYGFAITDATDTGFEIGVFEKVADDIEFITEVAGWRTRELLGL